MNRINKRWMLTVVLGILMAAPGLASRARAEQLSVVTTLATYASIAKSIGGDKVDAISIASPRFNPHFIEPRPSDVFKIKRADLFIHSGLDLEAWRDPLLNAAGRPDMRVGGAKQLDLSPYVSLLEVPTGPVSRSAGDIHLFGNPHYWLDPNNGLKIAHAISDKLAQMDPENASTYRANLERFTSEIQTMIPKWQDMLKPFAGQQVIGYHNEWVYLMNFLGLKMDQFLEPKPGIPPTPQQIEFLIGYAKEHKIKVILQPTFYGKEAGERVAKESGATLVLGAQSVGEIPEATDYRSLIDYDVRKIVEVFQR